MTNIKKFVGIEVVKKLSMVLLEDVILPMARDYVKKTDNVYDDKFVEFIADFARTYLNNEEKK